MSTNFMPESIAAMLKQQISEHQVDINVDDIGTVVSVGDGITHIIGLKDRKSTRLNSSHTAT